MASYCDVGCLLPHYYSYLDHITPLKTHDETWGANVNAFIERLLIVQWKKRPRIHVKQQQIDHKSKLTKMYSVRSLNHDTVVLPLFWMPSGVSYLRWKRLISLEMKKYFQEGFFLDCRGAPREKCLEFITLKDAFLPVFKSILLLLSFSPLPQEGPPSRENPKSS